ncbi:metallophosphoesterase family protein [Terracidiphilus gabretensis]|uniref:metallophosphoesterase family protein n=1 Tax=Terracidiphilus gabretensis TaxID=1577687 RepID=UPI00071B744F|nr:metallophosphoesterase family protein [Terracidiphilus gabretensis]
MKIGVVSDTHGLLRPEVTAALIGVERILHLGDVGDPWILQELKKIAPVTAVRGNIDLDGECAQLPETEILEVQEISIYLLHVIEKLDLDPKAAGFSAVLFGHSHKAGIRRHKDVLYFNPGSCGPRRFQLPVTMGFLNLWTDGTLEPEILELG